MSAEQLTREQVLSLPPACTLADLARALGVSEPTARRLYRDGTLKQLGIRVNKLGAQHRVITSSLLEYLGLSASASTAAAPRVRPGPGQTSRSCSPIPHPAPRHGLEREDRLVRPDA